MIIRSKHSNLLNYFIHDRRDLSFKQQATSSKRQAASCKPQAPSGKINWFKKKFDRDLK